MVPLSYYEEAYNYCQKLNSKFIYSIQINGNLLNEINGNDISCYIQKGILNELKEFIVQLESLKDYDKLNYGFKKVLIKRQ